MTKHRSTNFVIEPFTFFTRGKASKAEHTLPLHYLSISVIILHGLHVWEILKPQHYMDSASSEVKELQIRNLCLALLKIP